MFIEVVKVFPHAADLFHPPGAGAQFSRKQQSDLDVYKRQMQAYSPTERFHGAQILLLG